MRGGLAPAHYVKDQLVQTIASSFARCPGAPYAGHLPGLQLGRAKGGTLMDSSESAGRPETPTFNDDIRPLFRDKDRNSMRRRFDLWDQDDVRAHSKAILGRLQSGTMPCDGAWPSERVAVFRRWVEGGMK